MPRCLTWFVVSCAALASFGCGYRTSVGESSALPKEAGRGFELVIQAGEDPAKIQVVLTAPDEHVWANFVQADAKAPEDVLTLHLADEAEHDRTDSPPERPQAPSLLCSYRVEGKSLILTPKFPLLPGQRYTAYFSPDALGEGSTSTVVALSAEYEVPRRPLGQQPSIAAIYPTAETLPANHLKFYLIFTQPMQQGDIFRYFQLIDETTSEAVPRPFRHTELWSHDGLRLTLWFHPGRQKTGVNLNVEIGPILDPGHQYRLVVSGDWHSESGSALGGDVAKQFRAGPADHRQPDYMDWELTVPKPGTNMPLRCMLDEPLDWALLQSRLHVEGPGGEAVPGHVEIGHGESTWTFTPLHSWEAAAYRLVIGSVLEDLAGNSIERPFEVDLAAPLAPPIGGSVYREFRVDSIPAGSK